MAVGSVPSGDYCDPLFVLDCGKRRFRSMFWRVRAEIRRQVKGRSKKRLSFHYDSFSYALNFDNSASGFFC